MCHCSASDFLASRRFLILHSQSQWHTFQRAVSQKPSIRKLKALLVISFMATTHQSLSAF